MNNARKDIHLFKDYKPHEKQKEFHKSKARFKTLAAGTRSGKTYGGAREFIKRIYEDRSRKQGRLNYWIVAPDYNLTEVAREEIADILGADDPEDMASSPLVKKFDKSKLKLWLHGKILIEFKSAERPEKLVSRGLDGVWMDEAARCSVIAWSNIRARLADRQGWALFSSTPMGKNWFYEQIFRLGDRLDPLYDPLFASFQFTTVDNTAVPGLKEEVELARKQMPWRYFKRDFLASFDAFLGQIYDEFDRKVHVVDKHPVFARVIACKDWGFKPNPGVTLIIGITGAGDWYVIHEEYRTELLITPVDEKDNDPCWVKVDKELQDRFNVECFYCDPSEPEYIAAYRKAGIRVKEAKNSVLPGIQAVATYLHINADTKRPRLFICEWCLNTIKEIEGYHWKQLKDGTVLEEPDKKDDHTCLIAGTKVLTINGEKAIEDIIPGDLVLTRNGYRPVLWQGITKKNTPVLTVEFSDGRRITGTENHPVWINNKGWVALESLKPGDSVITPEDLQRDDDICKANALNSTGLNFGDTQNRKDDQTEFIILQMLLTEDEELGGYMKRSGRRLTGLFQTDILYIIKTVIRSTITSKILNVLLTRNITKNIPICETEQKNICKKFKDWLQNGMGLQKGVSGIPSTAKKLGKTANLLKSNANNAAKFFKTSRQEKEVGFAATLVSLHGEDNLEKTMKFDYALSADNHFSPTNIAEENIAPQNALKVARIQKTGYATVYNIKVAETSEYFAEGVLVHNCDAVRYGIFTELVEGGQADPFAALLLRTMKIYS